MATDEHVPVLTLRERIAALQLAQAADNQNSKVRGDVLTSKPATSAPTRQQIKNSATPTGFVGHACGAPGKLDSEMNSSDPIATPKKWKDQKGTPPSLPPRRASQPATGRPPALPPRRPSELSMNRKQSNESMSSVLSTNSSLSAVSSRTSISTTLESNKGTSSRFRVKAPEYDHAKLPALPERRKRDQSEQMETRAPLIPSGLSSNAVPRLSQGSFEIPPSLPARHQVAGPPPVPRNRPPQSSAASSPYVAPQKLVGVVELDANTFDDVILRSGTPAFVDFYAPFCKYCKELDPIYDELAINYQHKNITIAKIDSYGHKAIGERYEVNGWPQLKFFDGTGGPPVDYQWSRDIEWMSRFIDEKMAMRPASDPSPPPIPVASRPVF